MNEETQHDQPRSPRDLLGVWLCWLAVIVVLYVLGAGPVAMLIDKKLIVRNSPICKCVMGFYSPVTWLYLNTPLRRPLGMYLHLWTPNNYDSKGKAKAW
ncbi:MAG: hypothetical protein ACLQU3_29280 [Limisphaerales bacterium]